MFAAQLVNVLAKVSARLAGVAHYDLAIRILVARVRCSFALACHLVSPPQQPRPLQVWLACLLGTACDLHFGLAFGPDAFEQDAGGLVARADSPQSRSLPSAETRGWPQHGPQWCWLLPETGRPSRPPLAVRRLPVALFPRACRTLAGFPPSGGKLDSPRHSNPEPAERSPGSHRIHHDVTRRFGRVGGGCRWLLAGTRGSLTSAHGPS